MKIRFFFFMKSIIVCDKTLTVVYTHPVKCLSFTFSLLFIFITSPVFVVVLIYLFCDKLSAISREKKISSLLCFFVVVFLVFIRNVTCLVLLYPSSSCHRFLRIFKENGHFIKFTGGSYAI